MPPRSAGLLMYRPRAEAVEVFLVHPGGPLFARKDDGFWGIPKGHIESGETFLDVARREFEEETGVAPERCAAELTGGRRSPIELIELGSVVQLGGKIVSAWAFRGDWPAGAELRSNLFRLQWPPRSGRWIDVPEVDRGEFFSVPSARRKINPRQEPFLDRLLAALVG